MAPKVVTEAGYYAGKFLKPGQSYEESEVDPEKVDLEKLSKEELMAEAVRQKITVPTGATKPEVIKLLSGQSNG
ncbi:hypothetical protein [Rhizobium skierniewicense]|uniref:hypothetical protein n=1 Tax=Rhizobium skierniewicense TaxID=984260 RepID=UPI0015727676|nr:hypothetical protein [Rhizobium skierniewicense]NTF32310.1 hypothetical protein [Rhizobium skierniewicense]